MERNYQDWMQKTLQTETQEWLSQIEPEEDVNEKYYHTSAPVIIFQMIDQNLQVTNTIDSLLTFRALILSIQQVTKYGQNYRNGMIELKEHHFKDRSLIPFFTIHVITIVNNCQQMMELSQQMKQLYWPKSRTDHYEEFEQLLKTFQDLRDETASVLLEESCLDMEIHFNELFTIKWLTSSSQVDTICVTLEDYFRDYTHLRVISFEHVINEAQRLITKRYLKAMLSKRISKTKEECEKICEKIVKETKQIKRFFEKIAPNVARNDSPIDIIPILANLIACDTELLILDLLNLLGSYPSITEDHLLRLFSIRQDVRAVDVKEQIQIAMKEKKSKVSHDKQDSIFKEIIFNDKLW